MLTKLRRTHRAVEAASNACVLVLGLGSVPLGLVFLFGPAMPLEVSIPQGSYIGGVLFLGLGAMLVWMWREQRQAAAAAAAAAVEA